MVNELPTTELQHLHYRRFMPAPQLRAWVQCYWSVWTGAIGARSVVEKLYPDGGSSLIFDLTPTARSRFNLTSHTHVAEFGTGVDCIGVRFHPGGAYALLGLALGDLGSGSFAFDDLRLDELSQLQEAMAGVNLQRRIALLETWLLEQAALRSLAPGRVQRVLPLLLTGSAPVEQLIRNRGLSRRTLERDFQREVGFAPKQINRFSQLRRARLLLAQADLSISEVALACGFHDQAHFSHHFRRLTLETPGAYRRRKLAQIYNPKAID